MKDSLEILNTKNDFVGRNENLSLLKHLREKRNISQSELARRANVSRKKLHTLEHKKPHQIELGELHLFAKALGYQMSEIVQMMHTSFQGNLEIKKVLLDAPTHELSFAPGVKLQIFVNEPQGNFLGLLNLDPGKSVQKELLPLSDLVLGIVFEGTLLIDCVGKGEQVIKSQQIFYLKRSLPIEFCNTNPNQKLSILFFSARFSEQSF